MKVLLVNGSPHRSGNTNIALEEVAASLNGEGIETEIIHIGTDAVHGCIACGACRKLGHCAFDDDVCNRILDKARDVQGFVFGSPVYYAQPNGALLAVLQRLAFAGGTYLRGKVAASVAVCRRGGASTAFQTLNLFYGILGMPVASSQYWNLVYGAAPGDALQDGEGLQTMRTLGKNMAWMVKGLRDGRPTVGEVPVRTNFIR